LVRLILFLKPFFLLAITWLLVLLLVLLYVLLSISLLLLLTPVSSRLLDSMTLLCC
jgi:hypothetical protein